MAISGKDPARSQLSDATVRTLFETMHEGFAFHEVICNDAGEVIDYRYLDINPAFEQLTGLKRETTVGRTVREVLPDIEEEWIQCFGNVALSGIADERESYVQELDRYYRARAYSPEKGKFAVVFEETTAQRRSQRELERREALYNDLVETATDLVWRCDSEGRYIFLNSAWETVFGYTRNEMLGHQFTDFMSSEQAERDSALFAQLLATSGQVTNHETVHLRKDGTPVQLVFNASFYHDAAGQIIGTQGTAHDISERKRAAAEIADAHQRLADSETLYRTLFEQSPDGISLHNPADTRPIFFNTAMHRQLGYSREEFASLSVADYEELESPEQITARIEALRETGSATFESVHRTKQGELRNVLVSLRTITVSAQIRILAIVRDITEQRKTEQRLAMTVQEWQETFDSSADAIWLLDMERTIIHANRATRSIFGLSAEEACGRGCCSIVHQSQAPIANCPFDQMVASRRRATIELQFGTSWYQVSLDPVFDETGRIVRAVHLVKDISRLKKSELREYVRSEILERIAKGDSLESLLGFIALSFEKEQPGALCSILLVSEDGQRLLNGAAPSLPAAYNSAVHGTKIGEGIGSCGTSAFRRKRVIVEDIASHPFWQGFTPAAEAGLRSCWSEPVFSSSGKLLGTFAIYHTHPAIPTDEECHLIEQASAFAGIAIERNRAEAERRMLEQQLLHAQKLESLGVMAGGIAHDFNNILTAIIGNADLAIMRLSPESPVLDNLQRIEKAAGRAADLARQMLAYSGKGKFVVESIDLNRLVEEMGHMLEASISKKALLRYNFSRPLPAVNVDATQIRQIVMNLVINASEAIGERSGVITITTGCQECTESYLRDTWLADPIPEGLYVFLEVTDTGCGMEREILEKIFDPFFTTKFTGRGLGMAAVLGIIRGHKGAIKISSEPDKGSSFKMLLPVGEKTAELFSDIATADAWQGSGTVLLVDDEETVRAIGSEMLRELGFEVVTATDGRDALEVYRSRSDIRMVVMDLTMPHLDGEQCFRELRRLDPDIKIIISSGFSEHEVARKFAGNGLVGVIQKPYKLSELKEAVRNLGWGAP